MSIYAGKMSIGAGKMSIDAEKMFKVVEKIGLGVHFFCHVAGKNPPRVRFFLLASRVFIPRIPIFYVVGGEKMRSE